MGTYKPTSRFQQMGFAEAKITTVKDDLDQWLNTMPFPAYVLAREEGSFKVFGCNLNARIWVGQGPEVPESAGLDWNSDPWNASCTQVLLGREMARVLEFGPEGDGPSGFVHALMPMCLEKLEKRCVLGVVFPLDRLFDHLQEIDQAFQAGVLDEIPAMVALIGGNLSIQSVNRPFANFFGQSPRTMVGTHLPQVFSLIEKGILAALKGSGTSQQVLWPVNHELKKIKVNLSPRRNPEGDVTHCLVFLQELSDSQGETPNLMENAYFDHLTQLPDRRYAKHYLSQVLQERMKQGHLDPIYVLLIDIDNFKVLNDIHGHEFGDKILGKVARRILNATKDSDLVARLGGDEFLMVIQDAELDQVALIENRLLKKLMEPFQVDDTTFTTTVSMGVSVFPKDGKSVDKLLRKADTAMYHAKGLGRNRSVHFRNMMEDDLINQSKLMSELQEAVKQSDFYMVYQPVWDVKKRRVVAAEALIRWENQLLGTVPPGLFIPAAEKSWLIDAIGKWGLTQALTDLKALQVFLDDPDFAMNINISASQLRDASLRNRLVSMCREMEIPLHTVELEITERMLIGDVEHAAFELKELSQLGVVLAIDDFGTGYSSFGLLRDISFKTIKIDQSFIQDLPENTTLVDTMLGMAKILGLKTVAEGVETEAQRDYLEHQGCEMLQGYLIAYPMAIEELVRFVKNAIALS